MADLSAIRAAIATKVGAVSGIAVSTSSNFGGVVDVPAYLVNTVETIDMVDHDSLGMELREFVISCDLLLAKAGDMNDAVTLTDSIVEAIYVVARQGITLGQSGTVYGSWIQTSRFGALTYAGQEWFGAKQEWRIRVSDNVTRTA